MKICFPLKKCKILELFVGKSVTKPLKFVPKSVTKKCKLFKINILLFLHKIMANKCAIITVFYQKRRSFWLRRL